MTDKKPPGTGEHLCFVCYADDRHGHKGGRFAANQEHLCKTAESVGITDIRRWNWQKLQATDFFRQNSDLLAKNRFENGAAWKPFVVLDAVTSIPPGGFVIYYDCGPYEFRTPISKLITACRKNGGFFFHHWGDTNAKWSRRDAFVLMNADVPEIHNAVHVQNTWFIVQNVPEVVKFLQEWLHFNVDERIATYVKPNVCGLPDLEGFIENRGDQTIASILLAKRKILTFRGWGGYINRDINAFIESIGLLSRVRFRIKSFAIRIFKKTRQIVGPERLNPDD
jgi:hypothetical protein